MKANEKIKAAKKANEKLVLTHIKFFNHGKMGYKTLTGSTISFMNAVDRLKKSGKIVWKKYQSFDKTGYWIVK